MDRVCLEAEKEAEPGFSNDRLSKSFLRADEAIAMSAFGMVPAGCCCTRRIRPTTALTYEQTSGE